MHRLITTFAAATLLGGAAVAQTTTTSHSTQTTTTQPAQTSNHNPALKSGAPHKIAAPAKGANSFTAGQARGRLAKAGYTKVTGLKKADGLWHATATKDGKQQTVTLDYKGNITAQ